MPPTTRGKDKLNAAPDDDQAFITLKEENESLRAEVQLMREHQEILQKDNTRLQRSNTRLKNQKAKTQEENATAENSASKTKDALDKLKEVVKARTQKRLQEKEQYEFALDSQRNTHEAMLQEEGERYEELLRQTMKLKQNVAVFSRLDNQIGDERFRETMSCAFVAIKDCFWSIARKGRFDIQVADADVEEQVARYVPSYSDNTAEAKEHVCIVLVSLVLVDIVNDRLVFGWPGNKHLTAASNMWKALPEFQDAEKHKKSIRWLTLTKDILNDISSISIEQAKDHLLGITWYRIQMLLMRMTTLEVTESIRAELMDAIAPCVQDLCMLDYQRWQYKFMLLPAHSDSFLHDFDPAEAEGMFTEKTGKIGASLFPQLARWETGDTERFTRSVVFKARVSVLKKSDASEGDTEAGTDLEEEVWNGFENDNTDAEESFVQNTDEESMERAEEDVSQVEEENSVVERDVGEPMDVDQADVEATKEIESSIMKTPERGNSEGPRVIQDSFDRAEEESIARSAWFRTSGRSSSC
ncbi:hypothetical protein D6C79_03842 [Aureobasidium pullulans]|nr:hypothetical protein D6C79_03842 [Aureobasidium pullulans]